MYPTPSATRCSATASLSSQVSEMPTCCDPSRSVVSYSTTSRSASYGKGDAAARAAAVSPRDRTAGRAVLRVNRFPSFNDRLDRGAGERGAENAPTADSASAMASRGSARARGVHRAGMRGDRARLRGCSARKSKPKPPFEIKIFPFPASSLWRAVT